MKRIQTWLAFSIVMVGLGFMLLPHAVWAQKPAPTPVPPATTPAPTTPAADPAPPAGNGFVVCGNSTQKPCGVDDIFRAVVVITNELIALAGVFAIIAIVVSGFQMVIANGNPGDLAAAKGRLWGAFIGIFLVSAAFMLVNTLLSGSFGLGIQSGADAILNPLQFINDAPANAPTSTKTP